jgi:hypothetical protein
VGLLVNQNHPTAIIIKEDITKDAPSVAALYPKGIYFSVIIFSSCTVNYPGNSIPGIYIILVLNVAVFFFPNANENIILLLKSFIVAKQINKLLLLLRRSLAI